MVGLGEFKDDLEAALAKFKEAQAEKADAAKKRKAEATEGDGQVRHRRRLVHEGHVMS